MGTSSTRGGAGVSPLRVFVVVLLAAFIVEGAIMLVLPHVRTWPAGSVWDSVVDASVLTMVFAPALWYMAVRPLRELSKGRGELLARLYEVQEDERAKLARDLHDELGQHLTALLVGLRAMERGAGTDQAREHARSLAKVAGASLDEVRRLVRGLRPAVLEDFGLPAAVERLCEEFQAAHGVRVELSQDVRADRRYAPEIEATAYRLVQESLTNVARHAGASRVEVSMREDGGVLVLAVRDNGKGIDGAALSESVKGRSLGLRSMRERAELLGGSFAIGHAGESGTTVEARLPARSMDAT